MCRNWHIAALSSSAWLCQTRAQEIMPNLLGQHKKKYFVEFFELVGQFWPFYQLFSSSEFFSLPVSVQTWLVTCFPCPILFIHTLKWLGFSRTSISFQGYRTSRFTIHNGNVCLSVTSQEQWGWQRLSLSSCCHLLSATALMTSLRDQDLYGR